MSEPASDPSSLADYLKARGRVTSLEELQALVVEFERILESHGVEIASGSQLETACLAICEAFHKYQHPEARTGQEDTRALFGDVLGIWALLKRVVQFQHHPTFPQFAPHLHLLNKGPVVQNTRLPVTSDASNKIFELLFALVLLNVGTDLLLDHPSLAQGDNPDILVTIGNQRWGFALKTVHGRPAKTFFDNVSKGVDQIEESEAEIGCVLVNFRHLIDHRVFLPILNPEEHAAGAAPDFGAYQDPIYIHDLINREVTTKENEIRQEIGQENLDRLFAGKKAIPGFAAFYQTCASRLTCVGPVPSDITSLGLAKFGDVSAYLPTFEMINLALHDRLSTPEVPG